MRTILGLGAILALSACVAPEAPPPPKLAAPAVAATPRVGFDDAPLPNRKVGPVKDSVIQLGR